MNIMEENMLSITREEYEKLKRLERIDFELVRQFHDSLEDLKEKRVRQVA